MTLSYPIRLNKFVAHCGLANRRKAEGLISAGHIRINGKVELNPATRIQQTDEVTYKGKAINILAESHYLLINKPKSHKYNLVRSAHQKNLSNIIGGKIQAKLQCLGSFSDQDIGLVLLSNNPELIEKIDVGSKEIEQHYKIKFSKEIDEVELEAIKSKLISSKLIKRAAANLEEDPLYSIHLSFMGSLHVDLRAIFQKIGYKVLLMDRILMAGMTKKNLTRGFFRRLTVEEIRRLKYF